MADFQLAEVNVARMSLPLEADEMREFVELLAPVNALADRAPGFVWRLQGDEGNATYLHPYDDRLILFNLSVWGSIEELKQYVYGGAHAEVFRRRKEWFQRMETAYVALWWVPAGHRPSVDEAKARLEHLRRNGATPFAFTFKQPFPPEEKAAQPWSVPGLGSCPV